MKVDPEPLSSRWHVDQLADKMEIAGMLPLLEHVVSALSQVSLFQNKF